MNKDKVLDLARLARIELQNDEAENLSHEFEAILNYVGEVKTLITNNIPQTTNKDALWNVMREDEGPHESGLYTKEILEQAPTKEGGYIKVKKIL